jgi:antitoxin HicB
MFNYPAVFKREGKGYVVSVPELPEVVTEGDTIEEATEFAADAIEGVLAEYVKRKWDIPAARPTKRGMRLIRLPLLTQAKLSLYVALRGAGMRKAELARRMGVSKVQVERMLDLDHASRLEQIEAAFKALHKQLSLEIQDAA